MDIKMLFLSIATGIIANALYEIVKTNYPRMRRFALKPVSSFGSDGYDGNLYGGWDGFGHNGLYGGHRGFKGAFRGF
jgi:hypothetical protein